MTRRAKKGSVTTNTKSGKIRIILPRSIKGGQQHHLYTGLDDTPINRKKVRMIALQIETDIELGCLDCSLEKYKLAIGNLHPRPQQIEITPDVPKLKDLWVKFCDFKQNQVAVSTFKRDYLGRYAKIIALLPNQRIKGISDAIAIRDHLVKTYPIYSAKRYLCQINACLKWSVKSGLVSNNFVEGLTGDIKVGRRTTNKIDPFTPSERDAIIAAFESHSRFCRYTGFVRFLFLSGCRLGEAIGLKWKHINADCTNIYFCESYSFHGRRTTKTGINRNFPCNQKLRELLLSIRPEDYQQEALVFPCHITGSEIKGNSFTGWVWRESIVRPLVATGKVARYRCPYQARKTFISECLQRGVPVQQVSQWCGNSPEVIYRHYAGILSTTEVPEF